MDGLQERGTFPRDFSIRMVFQVEECPHGGPWLVSDGIREEPFLVAVADEAPASIRVGDWIVATRAVHQDVDANNHLTTTSTLSQIIECAVKPLPLGMGI